MKFIAHGAAQEVTGTCHEFQINGKRILLDCGLFQGRRQESAEKNSTFAFDPTKIDVMILSHAHMDHVGRVPLLWKKGYRGKIHCTFATKDLSAAMLRDGGYIQEKDEEFYCKYLSKSMVKCEGPLYTMKDAEDCMQLFVGQNYGEWFQVCDGVKAKFLDAGHIIGAAMIYFEITENGTTRHIGFSADLGRSTLPIIRDPSAMPPVDTLICESTYGNRKHEDITSAQGHLKEVIIRTAKRGGKIIIPAFSLERMQEIVYDLHVLWDAKEIPAMPIVIDSPLAQEVTEIFMKHPECYDQSMYEQFLGRQHHPFQFSLVKYTKTKEDSKALNGVPGPIILLAASGMCEAGRIRHHLRNEIADPRNTILVVGYMAENTLGRKIVDPAVREVKIFDEILPKKAEIVQIDAYSGHADQDGLDKYVEAIEGLKHVLLVHGELEQMKPFAERIKSRKPSVVVDMPVREQEFVL